MQLIHLISTLLAFAMAAGTLSAQDAGARTPDAEALLEATARDYREAKSFYFVAAEQTTTAAGDQRRIGTFA